MKIFSWFKAKKGYLSERDINKNLKAKFIGKHIVILDIIDSTNMLAKREAEKGALNGSVFIAENQTAGRGRLGRTWSSNEKDCILMSILLHLDNKEEINTSVYTLAFGLAVSNAIDSITKKNTKLKWPNDILINNKKLCGILCERFSRNNKNYMVIGIGINVNNEKFEDDLSNKATSLFIEYKNIFKREKIIAEVLNKIEEVYIDADKGKLSDIILKYKEKCISLGKNVELTKNNQKIYGMIEDISNEGELITSIYPNGKIKINSFDGVEQYIY